MSACHQKKTCEWISERGEQCILERHDGALHTILNTAPPSLPEINGDDDEWLYPAAPRPGRPRNG